MNECIPKPAPARILVRGVNWLGDAVMTTPALQRMRDAHPQASITLLTHEKLLDLWRGHRCVDKVRTFASGESPLSIGRRLRAGAFDTALVLPNSPRSAMEVWAAGIPRRIGYRARWRRWFLTETVKPRAGQVAMHKRSAGEIRRLVGSRGDGPGKGGAPSPSATAHHLHQYLRLAAAMGASAEPIAPTLEVLPTEVAAARVKWLEKTRSSAPQSGAPVPGTLFLGLCPSAAYGDAKRWPVENFAAVAGNVSRNAGGVCWLAFGGRDDSELCERLAAIAGVSILNLAGKTSLRELMALLRLCRVLVTNDSGPMHVAAALGTPVVVPFGSTAPELTGPGLPGDTRHTVLRSNAVCAPCFRRTCPIDFRCMRGISVAEVTGAVVAALQQAAAV